MEAEDEDGMRASHLAVVQGFSRSLRILLEYKCDPNARDKKGRTPAFLAVKHSASVNFDRILYLLREAGGNLDIADNAGTTFSINPFLLLKPV